MILNKKKPVIIADERLETQTDVGAAMRIFNENGRLLETRLQGILNQDFTDLVTVSGGRCFVGCCVQQQSASNAIVADAGKRTAANSVVIQALPGDKAVIMPFAKILLPLTAVPSIGGYQPLWLARSGNFTSTEPLTGYVQPCGWLNYFDKSRNLYSVTFIPGVPQWIGSDS